MSTLTYARTHGLTIDFTTIRLPAAHLLEDIDVWPDFDGEPNLAQPSMSKPSFDDEKLSLNIAAIRFLHDTVTKVARPPDHALERTARTGLKDKLELPLLLTDPHVDMLQSTARRSQQGFRRTWAERWPDQKLCKDLFWPLDAADLPKQTANMLAERLAMTSSTAMYLRDIINPSPGHELDRAYVPENPTGNTTEDGLRMSPPLMPLTPDSSAHGHDGDLHLLDLASTPVDPSTTAVHLLEYSMMEADTLSPRLDMSAALISGTIDSQFDSQQPPDLTPDTLTSRKRLRSEDYKLDLPLLGLGSSPSSSKKSRMGDAMSVIAPFIQAEKAACSGDIARETDLDSLENELLDLAAPSLAAVENEKLIEADSTLRMPIPRSADAGRHPPWSTTYGQKQDHVRFMAQVKKSFLTAECRWQVHGENSLPWNPVPRNLVKTDFDEHIGLTSSDEYVKTALGNAAISMDVLLWKADGLRILDEEDVEDDLDLDRPGLAELKSTYARVDSIMHPRSPHAEHVQPILQDHYEHESSKAVKAYDDSFSTVAYMSRRLRDNDKNAHAADPSNTTGLPSIDEFMHLQTGRRPPALALADLSRSSEKLHHVNVVNVASGHKTGPATNKASKKRNTMQTPAPDIDTTRLAQSAHFIVSSEILCMRELLREIGRLWPSAMQTERDFGDMSQTHQGRFDCHVSLSAGIDTAEADLLIAPGAGIVLTSLPKIKQKSLPGRPDENSIKQRLTKLASRYELIIVLVGHSGRANSDLDASDRAALDELTVHARLLSHDMAQVTITYVPGTTANMAQNIVGHMTRHCPTRHVDILDHTTSSEIFLRRAGMNAYAAQLVLHELRDGREGTDGQKDEDKTGERVLNYFCNMAQKERVASFAAMLGGTRMLEHVGRKIDSRMIA